MRAESRKDTRKATSKSAMAARARMVLIADLGWLEGVPLIAPLSPASLRWLAVPAYAPAVEMEIGRTHLSRATYALNKLRGEHAAALPSLAGEPEAWLASVERRLELLKRAVHHGEAPPADLSAEPFVPPGLRRHAAALAAAEPVLGPLLATLSWLHAGHPDRLRAAHSAVADWPRGAALLAGRLGAQESLVLLLRLAQLAMDHGEEKVAPLAAALFDERVHETPLDQAQTCVQILRAIARRPKVPLPEELPGGRLGSDLAIWCEELVRHNHRAQRQALRLFALATPIPLVAHWADWWRETRVLLREAQTLLTLPYLRESRHALRVRLNKHQEAAPPEFSAHKVTDSLSDALTARPSVVDRLATALGLLPAEATGPGRLQIFCYWIDRPNPTLLEGFLRYLKRRPAAGEALLSPWREVAAFPRAHYNYTVEDELGDRRMPRSALLAAYDFLAEIAVEHGGLKPTAARQAAELYVLAEDSALAARAFASLVARGRADAYFPAAALVPALRLCRERPAAFADVLEALNKHSEQGDLGLADWPESALIPLSTGDLGEMARQAIVDRKLDRLLACGVKAMLLDAAGLRPLPETAAETAPETVPVWIERYPELLHPVLRRLAAAVVGDAESRVARWLGDELPDPRHLEREIAVLMAKLAAGGAPEPRSASPICGSGSRIPPFRLRSASRSSPPGSTAPGGGRSSTAGSGSSIAASPLPWNVCSASTARRRPGSGSRKTSGFWRRRPGCRAPAGASPTASSACAADRHPGICATRPRTGASSRACPTSTGRRGSTASAASKWRPRAAGACSSAWRTTRWRSSAWAATSRPASARAPSTTTRSSPTPRTSTNGCSTPAMPRAPAAGSWAAACSRSPRTGSCLTFGPYCHDGKLDFDRLCAEFAGRLAQRMGAPRAAQGAVPTLVAPAWYDDGPRDLGGLHPALQKGSPLRKSLASLAPAELIGELRRALKPARLDQATLPLVIELPELAARPELAVPLLRPVAECRTFPEAPLVTVAHLALQAGAGELVRHLLIHPLTERLRRDLRHEGWVDPHLLGLFLRFDPARLLAFLRETRGRKIRGWLDETDAYRLESAADALAALHRPRQACELWQRLATSNQIYATSEQRQRAQENLDQHARTAQ